MTVYGFVDREQFAVVGPLDSVRHIATDGVAWSVCLSVCLSVGHVCEPCEKRLNRSRYQLGADLRGPEEPSRQDSSIWRSIFGRLSHLLKSNESLCCGVRSKRDHSVVNNGMTRTAVFRQNCLTACYTSQLWCRFLFYLDVLLFLANVNLPFCLLYAITIPSVVCVSSVTLVHPT